MAEGDIGGKGEEDREEEKTGEGIALEGVSTTLVVGVAVGVAWVLGVNMLTPRESSDVGIGINTLAELRTTDDEVRSIDDKVGVPMGVATGVSNDVTSVLTGEKRVRDAESAIDKLSVARISVVILKKSSNEDDMSKSLAKNVGEGENEAGGEKLVKMEEVSCSNETREEETIWTEEVGSRKKSLDSETGTSTEVGSSRIADDVIMSKSSKEEVGSNMAEVVSGCKNREVVITGIITLSEREGVSVGISGGELKSEASGGTKMELDCERTGVRDVDNTAVLAMDTALVLVKSGVSITEGTVKEVTEVEVATSEGDGVRLSSTAVVSTAMKTVVLTNSTSSCDEEKTLVEDVVDGSGMSEGRGVVDRACPLDGSDTSGTALVSKFVSTDDTPLNVGVGCGKMEAEAENTGRMRLVSCTAALVPLISPEAVKPV